MRIGSRQAPQQQDAYSRASASPADFGAGVATALGALGGAISARGEANVLLEAQERERQQHTRNATNNIEMLRFEGESRRRLMESRANQEAGAVGYTDEVNAMLEKSFNDFAKRLDLTSEERTRFAERFESFRQSAVTSAYAFEFEETNKKLISAIGQTAEEIQEELRVNPLAFDDRKAELFAIIDESALPPTVKDELKQSTFVTLASTAYMADVQAAMSGLLPAQPPESAHDDVVAPGSSAVVRGLAAATASVESAGPGNPYTRLYGGGSFSGYEDHPRIYNRILHGPNIGDRTSAAGKYQFLASTWDFVRRSMEAEGYDFGDQPFSPVNQDRAFWWYAQHRYRNAARRLGLAQTNLEEALATGDINTYEQVRQILSGEAGQGVVWEGLQHINAQQFMWRVRGGMARGALGGPDVPDIWNSPRYAGLPFDVKMQLDINAGKMQQQQLKAMMDARKEQEAAFMAQVREMFAQGDGEQAYALGLRGIQDGTVTSIGEIERIHREGREYREAYESAMQAQSRRDAGMAATPAEMDALNAEARLGNLTQGIREQDRDAAAAVIRNFGADGMLPSDITDVLFAQLDSGDTAQQIFALEMMADAYAVNPRAATRGMSREQAEQMALAATLGRFSASPSEFLQRYNRFRDPENTQMRNMRLQEADRLFEEKGTTAIFNEMYGFFARNFAGVEAPDIGAMPRFDHDARMLFREFYALFGDVGKAQAATAEVLRHSYTPSPLTNRIMEYSPSAPMMNVDEVEGSHDWIKDHVQFSVDTFVEDVATSITMQLMDEGVAEPGLRAREIVDQFYNISNIDIVADTGTLEDLQAGRPPSYLVSYTDELGQPRVLMNEQNQPVRIPMKPREEVTRAVEIKNTFLHEQTREHNLDFEIGRLEYSMRVPGGDWVPIPQADGTSRTMPQTEREARLAELLAARNQDRTDSMREQLQNMAPHELITLRNQIRPPQHVQDPYAHLAPPEPPTETERRLLELIDEYLYGAPR